MYLATDLDGTFLGGKSLQKQQLYRILRENPDGLLIYVTGRGLERVIPILNDPIIPNPDYIICDVGATIVNGYTLAPVESLQREIESGWPGSLKIRHLLENFKGLEYQEVPQQRRCSFIASKKVNLNEITALVTELGCEVIFSAGKYLDILPKNVNKGSSLKKLVTHLKINEEAVLVAGDTLNDLSLYEQNYKGVVVGKAEQKLIDATAVIPHCYHAVAEGAGGIIEAMEYFHFDTINAAVIQERKPKPNNDTPQLLIMYHRFPFEKKEIDGKIQHVTPKSPNGILPTLQSLFNAGRSGVWIAWEEVAKQKELLRNIYIDKVNYPNLMASRIGLTKKEIGVFYKSFAKEAFWPVIFSFIDKAKFNHHHWDQFVEINNLFAIKAAEQADDGAIIWIHDYNLWLVPGILRQLRPDLKIGFFHHTSFPAASTFNILPWRREIISSLLQCDYIGFHIPSYVENFMDVVNSLFPVKVLEVINCAPRFLTYSTALGVEKMTRKIDTGHRIVSLGANPVGINVAFIKTLMKEKRILEKIDAMKKQMGNKKLVLSVERLDYVKGPLEKILAFEQLLKEYPELHGKIELINICTPPAEGMKIYEEIKKEVEHAVGRINGMFARLDWVPTRLFLRSLPFEEVVVYYGAADIAWITPLRDGLNLVAKEYIAVQGQIQDAKGVLVLSEFAGVAVEMAYALQTNPYDAKSMKEILLQALTMSDADKIMRLNRLYEQVEHYDINRWADDFLENFSDKSSKLNQVRMAEPVLQ